MGLFRPYERSEAEGSKPETPSTAEPSGEAGKPAKKDAPTPSRREAEAARRERLNPTLTPKEAKAKERAAKNALRDEQVARTEGTPGKVLLRDFVDSRRGLAQYSMPILMVTLATSLLVTSLNSSLALAVTYFTYALFLLIALDIFLMWRRFKELAAARIPGEPLKGLLAYMLNRSINLRRLRLPAPRVKPGDEI
ncbi:MAG: DUF3043 domain-containing protein [Propionicimonas sp.]